MSKRDTARLDEFGKDLGLIHEVIVTGRKVGADRAFWAALAHDEDRFARVVALVKRGTVPALYHCSSCEENVTLAVCEALIRHRWGARAILARGDERPSVIVTCSKGHHSRFFMERKSA